jgi:hypothetical protein
LLLANEEEKEEKEEEEEEEGRNEDVRGEKSGDRIEAESCPCLNEFLIPRHAEVVKICKNEVSFSRRSLSGRIYTII